MSEISLLATINQTDVGINVGDVSVIELTEKQQKIIEIITQSPAITATQMAGIMAEKKRTIEQELFLNLKKVDTFSELVRGV